MERGFVLQAMQRRLNEQQELEAEILELRKVRSEKGPERPLAVNCVIPPSSARTSVATAQPLRRS